MKKFRVYYWIVKSFVSKHKKIILPAAIFGALTFGAAPYIYGYLPKLKTTEYIGRVGTYTLTSLPKDIQSQISDGLTDIDGEGNPIPNLATDWKILDDGQTYQFTLADSLSWQDGSPLQAQDISYNISDVDIEVIDDRTLLFKLAEPYTPFPTIVSQPIFKRINRSYLQVINQSVILGTGEFAIQNIEYDGNYLDSITIESETTKKTYKFFDTEKAAITAFKLAEIDVIEDVSDPSELADWNNVEIASDTNYQRYVAVFFNTQDRNLANKTIRQALTYAIPSKPNDHTRALSPINPDSWAYNPSVKPYEYSLDKARELAEGNNMDFTLELTTTPRYAGLAEAIKDSWQELGVEVKLKVVSVPDTQNYQTLLIGQQTPQDPDQYLLWHSTQNSNITGYQSPKIDKLLEDGRTETDPATRKEIYLDFQRFLVEDTPAAFLFYLDTITIKRA